MPHELPVGIAVLSGPDTLPQRKELAVQIIQIIELWNQTERNMAHFYGYLMAAMYLQAPPPGFQRGSHPVALQIFYELDNFRPKRELFEALLAWAIKNKGCWLSLYNKRVSKAINAANKSRNRLTHSIWGISDAYPDAVIEQPIFGKKLVWRASDFENELKKAIYAKALLGKFEMKVRKLVR